MHVDFVKNKLSITLVSFAMVATVAACGKNELRPDFDGFQFRSKLSKVDKQRDQFEVAVSPVSQSLEGAREAGRFEATKYCIEQYGTSKIDWIQGPDDSDEMLIIEKDTLHLRGGCLS